MSNPIIERFFEFMGQGEKYDDVSGKILNEFKGEFLTDQDEDDIITQILREYGYCLYKGGLFSFVNPKEYNDLAKKFPEVSGESIVFARTAMGCLFLRDTIETSNYIYHLNIHTGKYTVVSASFEVFIEWNLTATTFWERECYGETEFKVLEKYGALSSDECYAYTPALALGGDEDIKNIEKVKIKTHLELLAQLLN